MRRNTIVTFVFGIVVGVLLSLTAVYVMMPRNLDKGVEDITSIPGLTLLKETDKGTIFNTKKLTVLQTLKKNVALVEIGDILDGGIMALYIGDVDVQLYDDQKINIPDGKRVAQIGVYSYKANSGMQKTVPAISIK